MTPRSRREFLQRTVAVLAGAWAVPVGAKVARQAARSAFDVREAGVRGDGVTDDTAALREACRLAGPGRDVLLPAGLDCRVTGPIVDAGLAPGARGQRWSGGGRLSVAYGEHAFNLFDCRGIEDFSVVGLRAIATRPPAPYAGASARFVAATNGAHRCVVQGCRVVGFQSAVQLHGSVDCVVRGNTIERPVGWGINVQAGAHRASVAANRVVGVPALALASIERGARSLVFTTAQPHGYAPGDEVLVRGTSDLGRLRNRVLRIVGVTSVEFECELPPALDAWQYRGGASVRNALLEHGIYLSGTPESPIEGAVVADNTVEHCGVDGIKTTWCERASVRDNDVRGNGGQGIYLTIATRRTVVDSNVATGNGESGILLYDPKALSTDNLLSGNTLRDNAASGIALGGAPPGEVRDTRVRGNLIVGAGDSERPRGLGLDVRPGAAGTHVAANRFRNLAVGLHGAPAGTDVGDDNVFEHCTRARD